MVGARERNLPALSIHQIILSMKKIDVLKWGVEHIAQNHNFRSFTNDEEENTFTIYGGMNVPTLQDVKFLCEDLDIDFEEFVYYSDFGIDIFYGLWDSEQGHEEYEPTGMEMWKRYGFVIGN